ncbi:hypothetical protein SDRG_14987 [Saprolegnia diclina VS20]|uniref:CUB domain-containing protein n=1 Tax=Saprolegnia diclina (strain VS20) TaxID=1156394 RepID=T0PP22_SAPDV|nr:hypothetical protein SDRG_14987 [Saprolegnia diclina VS20]EQC27184.1 hypothetical protein SDRG_14987 [Saprolegnia diclina VS20]|eukprot:XP_008619371.1 hypothetical protein SDRG_14987 [Saprolegnia diclina VS20]
MMQPDTMCAEVVSIDRGTATICTDGVHLFVVELHEAAVAVHELVCAASEWARAPLPVLVATVSMSADVQAFWTSPEPFMCATNGHNVAAYRVDETRLCCATIDLATAQATATVAVSADCPVSAITLDLRNNILWTATGKTIMCHRNDGPRAEMPPVTDKDDVVTLLAATESSCISVLVRLFGTCNRVVDAYWSDESALSTALLDVAFAVDVCPSTFGDLIFLVEKLTSHPVIAPWQAFVVEVSLKLLSINTAQWSAAPESMPDHSAIRDVVQRSGLRDVLATLFQGESTLPRLRDASRRLYVLSIDMLYPSVDAQWALLATCVATNDSITLPLVRRMASRSKMQALVAGEISPALWSSIAQLVNASVTLTLAQMDGDTASERAVLGAALVSLVSTLLDAVAATCERHLSATAHVIGVVLAACDALCVRVATAPTAAFLQLLESSLLGAVAPKLFATVEYLVASLPAATPGLSHVVADFVPVAMALLERMQPLFGAVERRDTFVETKHCGSTAVVFESEHEYRNDMHEIKELRLDGAQSMTITFDSRCRSEYNYDYVVFYTDKSCTTFYGEDKYSGRDSSFNWPGVGNLPPLVIPADHCFVLFHSDGSNTDWGYKFTATANVTENSRSFEMHWLTSLEQCVLDALHSIVTLEAAWCPVAPSETALHRVLESDLLHGGMSARPTDSNDDGVVQFLHQLIDATDDDDDMPSAARVAQLLKAKTPQDQGTVPHINRAVRAVAAAILHHNMWGVDAYALGQGLRSDASPSLLRAWKNAQKMRNWFDIGDAQRPLHSVPTSTPTLQRQPSAFAGASEAALRTLCANVEARARFLLALGPASFSLAAANDPNEATKRWQLLAKYGVALQKSEDPASIVAKWHTLVDEVEAATQLQQLMLYRKSSAGRTDGRHAKTMTELVLEFVQSDVDVVALRAVIEMRNQRASLRRRSLNIVATTMATTTNSRLCHVVLSRWASSLRGLDQRHVHVLDHLAGCGADARSAVEEAYASLLAPLQCLLACDDPLVQLSALQCLAQDFAFRDGDMLVASRVVPAVFSLLQTPTSDVRAAAQAVVRILLERFVQVDKRGGIQAHIAACVADYTVALTTVPACRYLPSHAPGQSVVTPTPVPNVGFWMMVPEIPSVRLHEGDLVKHGPQWRDAAPDNAAIGVVTSIFNDVNVAVRWLPRVGVKEVHGCHVYDVGAKTFEIVPLRFDASGQILLKAHVLGDSWLHRLLGLSLTQTYHLDVALADGTAAAVHLQTPAPLVLGAWHHVGIAATDAESNYALYVDGAPVLALPLSLHLQHQVRNEARLVESLHPSVVKGWQYFTVDIDGASALQVAFDAQTTTGGDDDDACYVVFYHDDSHTSTWGDARYTSKNNLPGVDGNSPLDIAAGTFVLGYYTSEASADLWGFRLWVYDTDVLVRASPVSRLYVGEPPGRVGAEKAAGCYVHDLDITWRPTPEAVGIARAALPDPATTTLHDAPWHVLGCVLASVHGPPDVARQVLTPATFQHLVECAFASAHPVEFRCAATYVAAQSLVLHPRSGVATALLQEYVDRAMQFLIEDANPWAPPGGVTMAPAHASLVGAAYAAFVRAASTHPNVASSIEAKLKISLRLEHGVGCALAAAWVLGGDYDHAHVGTRIQTLDKRDNPEGTIEGGYIVSIDVVGDERVARVLFDLDPTRIESLRLDALRLDPAPPAYVDVAQRLVSACAPEILGAIEAATHSASPCMMDVRARLLKVLGRLCKTSAAVALLLPPLLCLAKATPSGSSIAVKPACKVLESTHPYKDSIDIYETVSFPGATSCRITFDAASRTEKDCDYMTFYKDNDKRDEFWGLERYSGRDDTVCFPGVGDEAPLVIPASHFTYYWHTDSSNNDWGWRFTVQAIFEPVAPSSLTIPQLNQRLCHLSEMLLELPPHVDTHDDAVTLTAVPSTVAPSVHGDVEISAVYFGESCSNDWVVVASKDVDVLTAPNATSITGILHHGTTVHALDVSGEWVRIAARDDTNLAGWMLRHVDGERTLAQPTMYAPLEHGLVFIGAPESNEAPVSPELDAGDAVRAVESHFDVSTIYAVETRRPHDLMRDLLESLGVQYARACLHAYVASERTDALPVDILLGLADLVVNSESPTSALSTLVQRLIAADGAFGEAVAAACTRAIARDLAALPKQPRVRRVESLLPNYHERICFPGTSTIRIEFDAATHCPDDGGVVFIGRDGAIPDGPYHGSADGDNWPGVGSKPPLLFASDTIHAFFRSDDESSEALVAFTAYDNAAGATVTEDVDALLSSLRLHMWVLLQVGCAHLPNMTPLLDATCQLYQAAPVRLQLQVLELWSTWLQNDATRVFEQLPPMHVHRFLAFLKTKLWAQHKLEEAHTTKSPLLRRLFQCVVDADEHLELYLLSLAAGPSATWAGATTDVVLTDDGACVQKVAASSAPTIVRSASGAAAGLNVWDILVVSAQEHVVVGLVTDGETTLLHVWPTDAVALRTNDIATVELDLKRREVRYLRNGALVCARHVEAGRMYYPAVQLVDAEDTVALQTSQPLQWLRFVQAINPPWYQRAVASLGLLECFHRRTDASSRFSTEIPDSVVLATVVRGADWAYDNEDGGVGNVGIVITKEPWCGQPDAAVRVQWLHDKSTALYRFGYRGLYDVLPAAVFSPSTQSRTENPHGFVALDGPVHVTIPNLPSIHGDWTIQLWFRREGLFAETQVLLHVATDANWWLRLALDSKRRLQLVVHAGQPQQITCPRVLALDAWTRVDVCAFGSGIAFHVNGDLVHHDRLGAKVQCAPATSTTLHLGASDEDGSKPWRGQLSHVRFWDAPMHMQQYYADVLKRQYNSVDVGEPATFEKLSLVAATAPKEFSDGTRALLTSYQAFTYVNRHGDFASLRPQGIGVLAPSCAHGKVYYELTLLRSTCLQLGWSFGDCAIASRDMGIGDCGRSFGVDLCRQAMWHDEKTTISEAIWQPGDVFGCLLDWHAGVMSFSLNGRVLTNVRFQCTSATLTPMSPKDGTASSQWSRDGDADDDDNGDDGDDEVSCADDEESDDSDSHSSPSKASDAEHATTSADTPPLVSSAMPETATAEATPDNSATDDERPGSAWLRHGGIFPSGSFLTGDGAIWNLGQRPFHHLPDGYVSVLEAAGVPCNAAVQFEIFDFEENGWQPVAYRHGVHDVAPRLLGAWIEVAGTECTVPDTSRFERHGATLSTPPWSTSSPQVSLSRPPLSCSARFQSSSVAMSAVHAKENEELVRYINNVCSARSLTSEALFALSWADVAPEETALVRWPLLAKLHDVPSTEPTSLSARFALLVALNKVMLGLLQYVDLVVDDGPRTLVSRLTAARGLLFHVLKRELWDVQVTATGVSSTERLLTLNRPKATRGRLASHGTNPFALFAQAYRVLSLWDATCYRSTGNLYKVTFLGENAVDGGGPYRETFTEFCAELQSPQLPLLLPTSNGQHNVGHCRDAYVLHPQAHVQHTSMLVFLGKLLGVAIRTKDCLSLTLSQVIWKLLVRDVVTVEDLEAVDALIVNSMRALRTIDTTGVTAAQFADVIDETFTTLSTDNRTVALRPHGDTIAVTFENRCEFADAVEQFRLHEFDAAVACVRRGLGMVVPLRYLRLFTWRELESLVCGSPDVDIDLLQQCTEYSSCSASDMHVTWFWDVLRAYSHDARRAFLRFVWGRSRLPRTLPEFQAGQQFKLTAFDRRPADSYMPVSHTCFFSLELPRYSSHAILEARLTYAIYNCQAIDGDGDTMAANQLGWED